MPIVDTPDFSSSQKFAEYIFAKIVDVFADLVKKKNITKKRAEEIAQKTLDAIQENLSIEQLFQNSIVLVNQFSELSPLSISILKEYEQKFNKKTIDSVRQLITKGDFNQAEDLVKKVLEFKFS